MPNYLIELYAPPKVISPDPEVAEIVVEAKNLQDAMSAANRIANEEEDSPESYVKWTSDPYYWPEGLFFGVTVIKVSLTDQEPEISANDILGENDEKDH